MTVLSATICPTVVSYEGALNIAAAYGLAVIGLSGQLGCPYSRIDDAGRQALQADRDVSLE